jgi:hypothetical protein
VDVLLCPCGARRALVSDLSESQVIVAILAHLKLPTEAPRLAQARSLAFEYGGAALVDTQDKEVEDLFRSVTLRMRCAALRCVPASISCAFAASGSACAATRCALAATRCALAAPGSVSAPPHCGVAAP